MVRSTSKLLYRTALSICALVVLATLLFVAALSRGPISLSFATPYFQQILKDQYPELGLNFDDLRLLWDGRDKNLVFGVTNVAVIQAEETIAQIPAVTVTFSGKALLAGRVAPSGLEFTGLKVLLNRGIDGNVNLGYAYAQTDEQIPELEENLTEGSTVAAIHELIAGLGQGNGQSDLTAYLNRLEIYQSGLFIQDEKLNKLWRITSANMVLWRSDSGLIGRLQGDANIGEEKINLIANAAYDRGTRTTVINTQVKDFPVPLIAQEVPDLEILKGITLPISGDLNVSLDDKFQPVQVGFDLKAAAGEVDIPSLYKKPLIIDAIDVQGNSSAPFETLNVSNLKIDSQRTHVSLRGAFINNAAGFGLSIKGELPEFATDDLALYWPYSAAVDGYNWVTNKVKDGVAKDASFRVDLPPGALETGKIPDGAIELKFAFEGLSADYFAPLPKVTNISGNGILTEKQVHVFGMVGKLQGMDLPIGDALIYDFDKFDQYADITIQVEGKNREIFEFLDLEPLGLVSTFGVNPSTMKGQGSVTANFVFPLRDDLQLTQVKYDAKGEFEDTFIADVYEDLDLSDGKLSVTVTPDMLTVAGPAKIKGNDAEVTFLSWFKGEKKGVRRYEILGKIDDAARQSLNVDTEYLTGPVAASLGVDVKPDGAATGVVTLNLLDAAIDIPDLHFIKKAGVPGLFGAQFTKDIQGISEISNIRLNSDAINIVGQAKTDREGLVSVEMSRIAYGDNDLSLSAQRRAVNDYSVNVNGRVFDLKPFIVGNYSLNEGKAEETKSPLNIAVNIAIDTVLLDGDVSLKQAVGDVKVMDGLIEQGIVNARFNETQSLSYSMQQTAAGRHLEFKSDSAGLLFQGGDLYDNIRDGTLSIVADIDDTKEESIAKGWLQMKDIRVVDAPVLGKILTLGSLGGIVDLLKNEGMNFATVEGPFTYENGLIKSEDFRAVGSIGITISGEFDQKTGIVDAFGTVIPSYTLNSILGNIPILGRLLVGREGEGIFGFSYKVKGNVPEPDITVNPVSALAPGILRRMFFEPWDPDAKGYESASDALEDAETRP